MTQENDDTLLSRNGDTSGGKKTVRLDMLITEEMADDVNLAASLSGLPRGEWARNKLEQILYGDVGMYQRMARQKRLMGVNNQA
jgi:hypothetical protein